MTVRHRFNMLDFASNENPNFMTIQTLTILPAPYDDGKKVDFPRRIRPRRETNFNSSQWFRENANWKNFLSKQIPVELPLITNKVARPTVTKPSTWDPLIFSNLTSMQSLAARTQTEFARSKVNFLKQSFYPDQHRVRNENYSLSNLPDGSSTSEKRNDRDRNISNFLRSTFHKNKIEDQSLRQKKTLTKDSYSNKTNSQLWLPGTSCWEESSPNLRRRRFSVVLPTVSEQQASETSFSND